MIKSVIINSLIIIIVSLIFSFKMNGAVETESYIEQYKTIAINEMNRVGIPASIKMAQAILESNCGKSTLAKQSNNHFGIKCGKNWTGREVYREDDDYENGLLIRSCFRAYDDPVESFYAHSDFLSNPYSKRYRQLFELDIYDYKAWAEGLKKAGYATDPSYPEKLINVIEKYRLFELDLGIITSEELAFQESNTSDREIKNEVLVITSDKKGNIKITKSSSKKYKGSGYHIVKSNENMITLSQKYGIDVKRFYMQNRIPFGAEPEVGEALAINKFIHFKQTPNWVWPGEDQKQEEDEYLWEETFTISSE